MAKARKERMKPRVENVKARPGDNLENLPALYIAAAERSISLSQLLEDVDPSSGWSGEDRSLGAFGRCVEASGFRFRSHPEEGVWASTYEEISQDAVGRALIPEWSKSVYRRTIHGGYSPQVGGGGVMQRASNGILGADENAIGSTLRPFVDAAGVYEQLLTPGMSLSDIVATTTPIDGDTYRRPYLIEPAVDDVRLRRIDEKTEIPRAIIALTEHTVRLYKYGRGIELSYEAIRRSPVDKVGLFIARVALQVDADRLAQGIDVLINGDGGGGSSAVNFNQGTLDTGTTPTVKGYIAFKQKFKPPYRLNLIIAREAELVALQLLTMPSQNPLFVQVTGQTGFGGLTPLQDLNGQVVFYGQSDAVAAGVYLGIDTRFALERITEIGSDIEETQAYVSRQTQALFFTENDGFALQDSNTNKTWTMA